MRKKKENKTSKNKGKKKGKKEEEKNSFSFSLTDRQLLASGAPFLSALYPDPLRDTKPPPPPEEEEEEEEEEETEAGEEAETESPSFLRAASKARRSSASSLCGTLRLPVPFLAFEEGPPLETESTSA